MYLPLEEGRAGLGGKSKTTEGLDNGKTFVYSQSMCGPVFRKLSTVGYIFMYKTVFRRFDRIIRLTRLSRSRH